MVQRVCRIWFSKIEPQGPTGDLEYHECVTSTSERLEFCSKIAVSVGNETYYFPKPGKLSNSLTVSFDLGNPRSRAGLTKATAMMANCIHQPLLFALCKATVDGHRADGGSLDLKHLRRLMGPDEEIDEEGFEERLEKEHMCFMSDPVAPKRMMQALERETGISVADQELYSGPEYRKPGDGDRMSQGPSSMSWNGRPEHVVKLLNLESAHAHGSAAGRRQRPSPGERSGVKRRA